MAKILVADDDREVRELSIFTLRFAGHEVVGASNGEEAIVEAKVHAPDLILMDVRMPKLNGFEACKILKADAVLSSIPVIFLSARGDECGCESRVGGRCGGLYPEAHLAGSPG